MSIVTVPATDTALAEVQTGFRDPAPIYSPVPIWWWSGEPLTRERLTWQMERLVEGGVRNAIVLNLAPRGPLFGSVGDEPPFGSEEWWALFRYVLEEGRRLGLSIWFYDQLGFSGARLQEQLVMAQPSCAGASLERLEADLRPGQTTELVVPPGATVLCAAAGRLVAGQPSPPTHDNPAAGEGAGVRAQVGLADLRDLSDAVEGGVRLRWTAPADVGAGDDDDDPIWRVLLFSTRPEGFDYLNPEAAARLIDTVHGEFARRCGEYLGTTLVGSFQDEFPALPRWTRDFAARFAARRGYDLLPWLPALFYDCGPRTPAVRVAYHEVAAALAEEAFFAPLQAWHDAHGLLCGYDQVHRTRAADPIDGQASYFDYFRTMRHYSAPGCDMDGAARPHSSIAHLYGRPRVWLEGFHSSGWGQTLEDIVTLLHPWYREGATLYNPHAVYYSTRGGWWEWAPPDTSWRQPYWRHYPLFATYVARLSYLLSQGHHVCDIALLYPATTMQAELPGGLPTAHGRAVRELWWAVNHLLDDERRDADILDDDSLERATVEDGRLCVSGERYRVLVLPGATVLRRESLACVLAFAAAGGLVVFCGPELPSASDTEGADDPWVRDATIALFGSTNASTNASSAHGSAWWARDAAALGPFLETHLPRAVSGGVPGAARTAGSMPLPSETVQYLDDADAHRGHAASHVAPHLPSLHRRVAGCDLFFVLSDIETRAGSRDRFRVARRDHASAVGADLQRQRVTFRATGIPELWDALSGEIRPVGSYVARGDHTEVELDFARAPACLVLFRPGQPSPPPPPAHAEPTVGPVLPDAGERRTGTGVSGRGREREVMGPWRGELWQTLDNRWGDLALPASAGPPPVECRTFRYRVEKPGEDGEALGWHRPGVDDADWEETTYSFGPYWWTRGPLDATDMAGDNATTGRPSADLGWLPCIYSQRLGIAKDPVYATQLGPRGHIPEEFIDLGPASREGLYEIATTVLSAAGQDLVALVGSAASKQIWVNGVAIEPEAETTPYLWRSRVRLRAGANEIRLRARGAASAGVGQSRGQAVRLWVRFASPADVVRQGAWIWTPSDLTQGPTSGRRYFRRAVDLAARPHRAIVRVSGDNGYRLYVNGALLDAQGESDAYIMGHVTTYDLAPALVQGRNVLAIEARSGLARDGAGHAGGGAAVILDGAADLPDGSAVELSSGRAWVCASATDDSTWSAVTFDDSSWAPARELAAPPMWFPGEPGMLLFRPRPHPLSDVAWLHGPAAAGPEFGLTYDAFPGEVRPVGWYRCALPPGTTGLRAHIRGHWRVYVDGVLLKEGSGANGEVDIAVPGSVGMALPPARPCAVRVEQEPGGYAGAAFPRPIICTVGPGTVELGAWASLGLAHYSGGLVYETTLHVTPGELDARWDLDLGRVRGTAEAWLDGEPLGVRLWSPYRFEVGERLKAGANTLRVLVLNTLGPHYGAANPSPMLYPGQDVSGLFGPVRLLAQT